MNRSLVDGLGRLVGRVADLAVPESCQLCGDPGRGPLCPGCRDDLPWIGPACPLCARPLGEPGSGPCGRCLRRPPPWAAAVAPLAWAFPADRLVGRLKYAGALFHARLLGGLLADAVGTRPVDMIVPVPLHPRRAAERGFNQAAEIARPVARRLGLRLSADACARVRAAPPQAGLPASARRGNVRGSFAAGEAVAGRAVAVVDDVLTTGATAEALARALTAAGASRVEVWTVVRAGLQAPRNV